MYVFLLIGREDCCFESGHIATGWGEHRGIQFASSRAARAVMSSPFSNQGFGRPLSPQHNTWHRFIDKIPAAATPGSGACSSQGIHPITYPSHGLHALAEQSPQGPYLTPSGPSASSWAGSSSLSKRLQVGGAPSIQGHCQTCSDPSSSMWLSSSYEVASAQGSHLGSRFQMPQASGDPSSWGRNHSTMHQKSAWGMGVPASVTQIPTSMQWGAQAAQEQSWNPISMPRR